MKLTKKNIKLIVTFIVAIVALIGGFANKEEVLNLLNISTEKVEAANISADEFKVLSVTDGDTIQIEYEGKKEKVRLIGVDTPESVHADKSKNNEEGKVASNYTKNLLTGKNVTLEFDVQKRDKYQRVLAYVYLDGKMVNKILLEEGYARLATYPPNTKYVDEFTVLQKEARENNKGFWQNEE